MPSYHPGSKLMIIICDSVNFAFLYFHKKKKINPIPLNYYTDVILDINFAGFDIGKDIVKNIKGQMRYNFRF